MAALLLTSCSNTQILAKPQDTSLEFWIAQDVSDVDFSEYLPRVGMFGGSQYYGKGYEPEEENQDELYGEYVLYTVTSYPDYSDKAQCITTIHITDPNVSVYGITCNSSFESFDETFERLGCSIQAHDRYHIATLGKVQIDFTSYEETRCLSIRVDVTNRYGIVF